MSKIVNESKFEKEAEVAANWWKENIGPKAKHDTGDFYSMLMMMISANNNDLNNEEKENFYRLLKKEIIEQMEKYPHLELRVDYGPEDDILIDLARKLRLNPAIFPTKTTMKIGEGSVKVKCGYGAGYETLYDQQISSQPGNE